MWLYGGTPNKKKYPGSPNANNVRSYARSYTYDKLGNVTQVKQTGSNGFTRNFNYTTGQNTLQLIEDGSSVLIEAFTYDANGNQLTAGTTRNYVWNHADQLLCYFNKAGSANPTVFTQYDYGGQARVSKLVRTGTSGTPIYERTIYIDGVFEYVILENGTTYEKNYIHLMDDQSRMAEVRVNIGPAFPGDISDAVTYTLGDQIGSSVVRLNSSGGFIDREEYYPFGDSSLRTFTYKRYRYVGKERDAESGLYYYGARYYAAWTCRFISVDPLAAQYVHLTPYNYAGNKPIGDYDIDGMQGTGEQKPDTSNTTQNTQTSTGNTPLAAPSVGATGKPVEQGPKFDYSFLSKDNISEGGSKEQNKDFAVQTMAGGMGISAAKASSVREKYVEKVKNLEQLSGKDNQLGRNLREKAITEMRAKTPEPFLSSAENMKPTGTQPMANSRFWVTNETVNESMVKVGALGKAFVVVGAYQSFENIKSDGYSAKSIATEASVWGGAWVGGQIGAEAGAIGGPGGGFCRWYSWRNSWRDVGRNANA